MITTPTVAPTAAPTAATDAPTVAPTAAPSATPTAAPTAAPTTNLHSIDLEKYPFAKCLDGTPGAFYFWPATNSAANKKWVIHHVCGGWCAPDVPDTQGSTVDSCYHRSFTNMGSSANNFYPATAPVGWTPWGPQEMLLSDPAQNSKMHDWNKVALVYCDGGSFSGRNMTAAETRGRSLYYRGSYIREAIADTLRSEFGLLNATDVVIGGSSAGGLATYLHVDKWREELPSTAFVAGLADDGFFLDWNASKPSESVATYAHELRADYFAFNATDGVNSGCVLNRTISGDVGQCFFAEHTAPFIKTPIFALQTEVDAWQVANILGTNNATAINLYRLSLASKVRETFLTKPTRGLFMESCFHHMGFWDKLKVNGTRAMDAFSLWYDAQRASWHSGSTPETMAWEQDMPYPCDTCCTGSATSALQLAK
jgi:hypothetical protein